MYLFYFTVVSTTHFTTPLNVTIKGSELLFSCSTSFKKKQPVLPDLGQDWYLELHYFKAQLKEFPYEMKHKKKNPY